MKTVRPLALLLLCLIGFAHASAASPQEEWVRLRVEHGGGSWTAQAPRAFLRAICSKPTGATIGLGTLQGRTVRMSADRLLRMLRDVSVKGGESLLFTRPTDQGPISFYAQSVAEAASPRSGTPVLLIFDLTRAGASPLHLALPLLGSGLVSQAILPALGLQGDGDLVPLMDGAVEAGKAVGTGPILRAHASDADLSVTLQ